MAEEILNPPTVPQPNPFTTILDHDKNTILHYSAARGKTNDFEKNVPKNQKLDIENYLGWTPLMMACRNCHVSTVKILLEMGADATKKNKFDMSVFSISVAGGNLEIVKTILEHLLAGGISKRLMQNILSPVSLSILFRRHDVMEYLIERQFDLNAATPLTGVTPLMFASSMEDNHAIELLLKNKADETLTNHLGDTADDIKQSRYLKQKPEKTVAIKLTPAEMISRSPHMTPHYFSSRSMFPNLSSNQLLCVSKSPAIVFTPTNISPITPLGMSQFFFPQEFSPNHYMTVSPIPMSSYYGNNLLNIRVNQIETELALSPATH